MACMKGVGSLMRMPQRPLELGWFRQWITRALAAALFTRLVFLFAAYLRKAADACIGTGRQE
jgi:hypothetical protein